MSEELTDINGKRMFFLNIKAKKEYIQLEHNTNTVHVKIQV